MWDWHDIIRVKPEGMTSFRVVGLPLPRYRYGVEVAGTGMAENGTDRGFEIDRLTYPGCRGAP